MKFRKGEMMQFWNRSLLTIGNLNLIVLYCAACIFQTIEKPIMSQYSFCPRNVLFLYEGYRCFTHVFLHENIIHSGMNLMLIIIVGPIVEKKYGTIRFVLTVLWSIILIGALNCFISLVLCFSLHADKLMYSHSVGFTGVLFHLGTLATGISYLRRFKLYPWAAVVLLKFVFPKLSVLENLSGIILGNLQIYGALNKVLPSISFVRKIEDWNTCKFAQIQKLYMPAPSIPLARPKIRANKKWRAVTKETLKW